MDPIPVISKIFSLVVQEERQRSIYSDITGISMDRSILNTPAANATVGKSPHFNKEAGGNFDKPLCSHCHAPGHTIDKFYRVHGYPTGHPRYKPKQTDNQM